MPVLTPPHRRAARMAVFCATATFCATACACAAAVPVATFTGSPAGATTATRTAAAATRTAAAATRTAAASSATTTERPIGIVDATPHEQAAVLSKMHVTKRVVVGGYTYWVGTIAGRPVVDVAAGEIDETAELATYLLDQRFHPRATLFSGTAGSQNNQVHVGDVVVGGYVADKSSVHYQVGGSQTPYVGVEVHVTGSSDVAGALVNGYGTDYPSPHTASRYRVATPPTDKHWVYVSAFAGAQQLVTAASRASSLLGSTSLAEATGTSATTGAVQNKVLVGVIGQANVWTVPLSVIEAQNMLYQTDAEENEGTGFAFANAVAGVPCLVIRGISDSPWYPNAYDNAVGAEHAAAVAAYVVAHVGKTISRAPASLHSLSAMANATRAGYLIAKAASYTVSPVTQVGYTNQSGKSETLAGAPLAALEQEYTTAAGGLG